MDEPTPPSWPELVFLMSDGPEQEPTVRGAVRSSGPAEGWVAYSGFDGPPPVAGLRPAGADGSPLLVWRDGHRIRIEEPDGQVQLIAGNDGTWHRDRQRDILIASPRRQVVYLASGTPLLERRSREEFAGDDFTRPTGPIGSTTFLGRLAWTVELAPPPHKPHPMQLVIDAQTGLVLQQRNDGLGTVDEWTEFVVGESFDEALFRWSGPSLSAAELRAIHEAEHQAEMGRRRQWFRTAVTGAPLRLEFDIEPEVHVHAEDGSFEASFGRFWGSLARRPHSEAPWELGWQRIDHRWSTPDWDWALSFDQTPPTPDSVQAMIQALSAGEPDTP